MCKYLYLKTCKFSCLCTCIYLYLAQMYEMYLKNQLQMTTFLLRIMPFNGLAQFLCFRDGGLQIFLYFFLPELFRHLPPELLVNGVVDAGAYVGREAAAAVYQCFPLSGG